MTLDGKVGLFFVIDGRIKLHTCPLAEAEIGERFRNYPESHDAVWQRKYANKYHVDYDYFPRGRIVYNNTAKLYTLYYDSCATKEATELVAQYPNGKCIMERDEHYQCAKCNKDYII